MMMTDIHYNEGYEGRYILKYILRIDTLALSKSTDTSCPFKTSIYPKTVLRPASICLK